MRSSQFCRIFFLFALSASAISAQAAQATAPATRSPAEAEAQKCEDKIASIRREVFGKYDEQLGGLQLTIQKTADLDGALAVRAERQRLAAEQDLSDQNIVREPAALKTLQTQTLARLNELSAQLVGDSLPRLIEFKKQLTVAGKLDEAVNVRTAIERLQNAHLPITKADASMVIPVETLLQAYTTDRPRADKIYKGQRISVHGVLGAYRPDPSDDKVYQIFLTAGGNNGWVQCAFGNRDFRFREEKGSFGAATLVMLNTNGEILARLQKGQWVDVRGRCDGFEDGVHLGRCDQLK